MACLYTEKVLCQIEVKEREVVIINNNNNNNYNITSMALKSSEARAQKRNKTKSVIIPKSRGHTGIIISFIDSVVHEKVNWQYHY